MRRGTFRRGKSIPVDSISHFDLIIHPEDSISMKSSEVEHDVPSITCSPITLIEPGEQLPKSQARRRLDLPQDATVVYVQIGAGEINDINSEIRLTVDALIQHEGVHIVLGESMLGERLTSISQMCIFFEIIRIRCISMHLIALYKLVVTTHSTSSSLWYADIIHPNLFTGMDDQADVWYQSMKVGDKCLNTEMNNQSP